MVCKLDKYPTSDLFIPFYYYGRKYAKKFLLELKEFFKNSDIKLNNKNKKEFLKIIPSLNEFIEIICKNENKRVEMLKNLVDNNEGVGSKEIKDLLDIIIKEANQVILLKINEENSKMNEYFKENNWEDIKNCYMKVSKSIREGRIFRY